MIVVNETSERLKQKAHQLFMQFGLRSVSMDDIAKELGISKKTIYQFYEDKDALVDDVMASVFENDMFVCERDRKVSENAVHEIFLAIDFIVEMFKNMNPSVLFDLQKHHPTSYIRFVKHKDEYLFSIIKNNLKRGIAEDLYRADIKVDVLARFRVESMMMPFNPEFLQKTGKNLALIEEEITIHFLYGLVSPKGYKIAVKYQEKRNKKVA
jgi:TetR/AcrR family transcriptional regulator, cholesterol catabolism regulator